jgi:hypothetical protein
VTEHGHLVDECNVDVAIGVLQQLGHLGLAGTSRRYHGVDDTAIELDGALGAAGGESADDLRCVAQSVDGIARVDSFGRVRQREIGAGDEAAS